MSREAYIQALLSLYCGLPDTAARKKPSLPDRQLAAHLFDQGISLFIMETALLLAVARRSTRDPELPPLPPIRSLAYFLPVVEELQHDPPDPGYLGYLRLRRDNMVNFSTDRGER
ncbi:MAG TPA: hypothetical protein VHR45_01630 [Thermoanaerobaculia bacterium]|nr:hypothetical protein [Thermoanaerobaculia bacterium]